jgi:hypothetical protein
MAKPTVEQHLAAILMLFDWLVSGQVVVLTAKQARELLDSIRLG